MNIEQKKAVIDWNWNIIKGILVALAALLGKDGLIEKITDLLDEEAEARGPQCPKGFVWNGNECVPDVG